MRRVYLAISMLIMCLCPLWGWAQNHYEANIAVGGQAGVTMSRVNFSPSVPQTMQHGFLFGGAFRYIEEKNFGLIVEVNVEQRGWKEKFEGYDYQYDRQLTYIQMPMLTHVYFGSSKLHGFFNAGPEIGYMMGASTHANFDLDHYNSIEGFPSVNRYTDQFNMKIKNRFDYGISLGAGMEWFKDMKHSFRLEGRFYYGLGDVFGNHKKDVFSASNSMAVMVSLGYFYRLK